MVVAADGDHGGEVESSSDTGVALFAEATAAVDAGAGLAVLWRHADKGGELAGVREAAEVAELGDHHGGVDEGDTEDATE